MIVTGNQQDNTSRYFQEPPAPENNSGRNTYVPFRAGNKDAQGLANSLYGTDQARSYGNVFDTGYENLGQPLHDNNRDEIYTEGTRALAGAFADRVFQKTGKLPSEDDVKKFVGQNLNTGFAQKFILGLPPEQITSNYVDPYIDSNDIGQPASSGAGAPYSPENLTRSVGDLYGNQRQEIGKAFDSAFLAPRRSAIEDEAALGRLRSPVSIPTLAGVDTQKAQGLASALAGSYGSQANSLMDLGKTAASLNQQNQQFGKTFNLQNRQFNSQEDMNAFNQGMANRQLGLARDLGKAQADAGGPNTLDYVNTGLGAAGTVAGIAAMFCWVAEELYGRESEKTHTLRKFLSSKLGEASMIGKFAREYLAHGQRWAKEIKSGPFTREAFRTLYDNFYRLALREASNG